MSYVKLPKDNVWMHQTLLMPAIVLPQFPLPIKQLPVLNVNVNPTMTNQVQATEMK